MSTIQGIIINDCTDDLARARQEVRFNSLFGVKPVFLGVGSYQPVEAAASLLDVLDVLLNFPVRNKDCDTIVLANVAPRGEDVAKRWENGTPFCYVKIGRVLIVSTYEERFLAILRDAGLTDEVFLLDIPTVTATAVTWGDLTQKEAEKIRNTQFRSLEFLPLVAYWLHQGKPVPTSTYSLADLPTPPGQVWHVDNFGNVKITLTPEDVGFEEGKKILLNGHITATCYNRLADVPKGVTSLTIGSSGFGGRRFLEIAVGHRGRAANLHNLEVGSQVLAKDAAPAIVHNTLNR